MTEGTTAPLPAGEIVTRVALLAGLGARARDLGALAEVLTARVATRTCLDAGGPLQVFVDAPGPRALRLGMATGLGVPADELAGWSPAQDRDALAAAVDPWRACAGWTVWSPDGLDWYGDIRGETAVIERAGGGALPGRWAEAGTPWAVQVSVRGGVPTTSVHWLLARSARVEHVLEDLQPGGGGLPHGMFAPLMGGTLAVARWVVAREVPRERRVDGGPGSPTLLPPPGGGTPDPPHQPQPVTFGCGRWSLVPEDGRKHEAVTRAVRAFDGPDAYAGAVWSLLRGLSGPGWRVGRGLEARADGANRRLRLILVPEVAARP